jgi:hypothetical protein
VRTPLYGVPHALCPRWSHWGKQRPTQIAAQLVTIRRDLQPRTSCPDPSGARHSNPWLAIGDQRSLKSFNFADPLGAKLKLYLYF